MSAKAAPALADCNNWNPATPTVSPRLPAYLGISICFVFSIDSESREPHASDPEVVFCVLGSMG